MPTQTREQEFDLLLNLTEFVPYREHPALHCIADIAMNHGLIVGKLPAGTMKTRWIGNSHQPGKSLVILQDPRGRIHTFHTRAFIQFDYEDPLPDPFHGSESEGLIPIRVANGLLKRGHLRVRDGIVILGSSHRALDLGARILEQGARFCVCLQDPACSESNTNFDGPEIFARKFIKLGGRILRGAPHRLSAKVGANYEFRFINEQGTQLVTVNRVISAGEFSVRDQVREYPKGSYQFEFELRALEGSSAEGIAIQKELELARMFGSKITRQLLIAHEPKSLRNLEAQIQDSKRKLKFWSSAQNSARFQLEHTGKWLSTKSKIQLNSAEANFPEKLAHHQWLPRVECVEPIACTICTDVCPTLALPGKNLIPDACIGCGICAQACPSDAISLEGPTHDGRTLLAIQKPRMPTLSATDHWIDVANRKGEKLTQARLEPNPIPWDITRRPLLTFSVPEVFASEARGVYKKSSQRGDDEDPIALSHHLITPRSVRINYFGKLRYFPENTLLSEAFFAMGLERKEDRFFCPDGACRKCTLKIDGQKNLACKNRSREGLVIQPNRKPGDLGPDSYSEPIILCSCLQITPQALQETLEGLAVQSPEDAWSRLSLRDGDCHGRCCRNAVRRAIDRHFQNTHGLWVPWDWSSQDWSFRTQPRRGFSTKIINK